MTRQFSVEASCCSRSVERTEKNYPAGPATGKSDSRNFFETFSHNHAQETTLKFSPLTMRARASLVYASPEAEHIINTPSFSVDETRTVYLRIHLFFLPVYLVHGPTRGWLCYYVFIIRDELLIAHNAFVRQPDPEAELFSPFVSHRSLCRVVLQSETSLNSTSCHQI